MQIRLNFTKSGHRNTNFDRKWYIYFACIMEKMVRAQYYVLEAISDDPLQVKYVLKKEARNF